MVDSRVMLDEQEIASDERLGIPCDDGARREPEIGTGEIPKGEPSPVAREHDGIEAEPEEGCPVSMGASWPGPRCGRKLHSASGGVDEEPVCLMHSKDGQRSPARLRRVCASF